MNQAVAATEISQVSSRARWRYAKDRAATVGVTAGGIGVIVAVVLIFFYLLWVVLPLFFPASMERIERYAAPGSQAPSLYYAMEEQAEVGLRVAADGEVAFFELADGRVRQSMQLPSPLRAVTEVEVGRGQLAALGEDGRVYRFGHRYQISYPEGAQRTILGRIEQPYGEAGIEMGDGDALAVRETEDRLMLAVAQPAGVRLRSFARVSSFLTEGVELEQEADLMLPQAGAADHLLIDPLLNWLYVVDAERASLQVYDVRQPARASLLETVTLSEGAARITDVGLMPGGISLLVADSQGRLRQWFPLRDANGVHRLRSIRDFRSPGGEAAQALIFEHARRGFVTLSGEGHIGLFHATAGQKVLDESVPGSDFQRGAFSPRANRLLLESTAGELHLYEVHNEHPEISFSSLWGKVWYESYQEPEFIWQSSAANSDFEPKFSLTPLAFGTLKAAFYAMLFAVPLALAGAIFTAYFMAPKLRQAVKPTVEVMEALPTVILGFLAGLWLAPFIETFLPGIFLMVVFLILAMPLTGWLWTKAPAPLRHRVPDGYQPVLLVLPLIIAGGLALLLSRPVEAAFFGGNMPQWLANEMDIPYDQRNSLVVGLAMGFAVIPTIFSIAEDAVFGVPKHLSQGSLALGATPWQTLVRVVLPTASPGIFSALMIGLGRAVGETMIVLMATGNTPIMDFNIFEGFRTLSANIAVEMPESEVGSTHFRILFLAGLVLFLFTFVFNTLAEIVRQRLRSKYSSL